MSGERLSPARPDGGTTSAYGPRVPWRLLVGIAVLAIAGVIAWQLQAGGRLSSRKQSLLNAHQQFHAAEAELATFRERIEALIGAAVRTSPPEERADAGLNLAELYQAEGLYLRLPNSVGPALEGLAESAISMAGDAVPRCLGVGPLSLGSVYQSSQFLGDAFRERVTKAKDELVVEALMAELKRRGMQHVSTVATARRADYFLLLVERGDTPRSGPVDAFLWRLSSEGDRLVLSTRTTPKGMLVPARIAIGGTAPARRSPLTDSPVADDCSIAAQIKAIAGEPLQEFHGAPASTDDSTRLGRPTGLDQQTGLGQPTGLGQKARGGETPLVPGAAAQPSTLDQSP